MGIIQQALEECTTCNQQNPITEGSDHPNNPQGIKNTGTTYDSGDGIKDTVMITGPLSHYFTKALNVKLKKEPLQANNDEPTPEASIDEKANEVQKDPMLKQDTVDKIGLGNESEQQMHQEIMATEFFSREFNENAKELDFIANKFDFVQLEDLPVNVVCKTTVIGISDFLKPSTLIKFNEDRTNSSIDHVVLVMSDALGKSAKTTTTNKIVNVFNKESVFEDGNQQREFTAAVESHVTPNGYKVFYAMEDYVNYLKQYSAQLQN